MSKYKCKICGNEFDRVGNGVYCPGPHYRPCPVCGKPVEYHRPSDPVTCCSAECSNKLTLQSKMNGVTRICKECGKQFKPKNGTQVYCPGPHTTRCKICCKLIEYTCSPKEKPVYCSKACRNIGKQQTVKSRYGVNNVSELQSVKDKISVANSSETVKAKREMTCMQRYGVQNVSQNAEIRNKLSTIMKSDRYLTNRANTCLAKYGTVSPMQNEEIKQKQIESNIDKYGTPGHPWTQSTYSKIVSNSNKLKSYIEFKNDPKQYIESNYASKPSIFELQSDLGVTDTPIYDILIANNCADAISHNYSSIEVEVVDFLTSTCPSIQIIQNDRTIIKPLELDIYLPEYKLAIECNPAATHNSSIQDPWGSGIKHYKYHQNKSIQCQKAGVFLFHIFGYEWKNNRYVIQSMIKNLLNKNDFHYGARQCYICNLNSKDCNDFLIKNHRQGATQSSVRLGLRLKHTDELVSVMTFGKPRNALGINNNTSKDDWELSRFCNKQNTTVVGSASKLFKYFISNYEFNTIFSFSDFAHTRGNLYKKLGFSYIHTSAPNYVWCTIDDSIHMNRVSCQKRNLRRLFNDDSIDTDNLTERQIMESHNFVQVYDSGVIRWEYYNLHSGEIK